MEKFHIKQDDELFSIIDNIKLSKDINIVLIVPSGTVALRSIINLRILKEESGFLAKNVYISTLDTLIQKLTKQAGIKIIEVQTKTQIKKPVSMGRVVDLRMISNVVAHKEEPVEEVLFEPKPQPEDNYFYKERPYEEKVFAEPLPERVERIKRTKSFKIFTPKFFVGVLILIALLGLAAIVCFVLPRAQVVITPKKEPVKFTSDIFVDSNVTEIKLEEAVIPGQFFDSEKMESKEFPSTGERDVLEKAKGKIIVYNQYSSSPQTLVKTTRFRSTSGKIFRLTSTVTIPGAIIEEGKIIASSKEVDVEADEAGDTYNIGPSDFNIPGFEGTPKYTAFYGKSTNPMTGGAKGKMKVATQDDIDGAMKIVTMELKDKVFKEFQKLIPADLKLSGGGQSLDITESSSSLKANQPGEKFTITMKIKAAGVAFKEQDASYLVERGANSATPKDKILLPSTVKIDYKVSKLDLKQKTLALNCDVTADSVSSFDDKKIKTDLAGKTEEGVKLYLSSLPNIEIAKIIFWPFWVKKVPKNVDKIKVLIKID
ncbi:MAG: hypothetical protein Q8N98_04085 [bacterium]|nr:hypothetical protein [bacterium]